MSALDGQTSALHIRMNSPNSISNPLIEAREPSSGNLILQKYHPTNFIIGNPKKDSLKDQR